MRPDLAPLNLLFFQCPFAASGRGALLIMPRPAPNSWDQELSADVLFVSVLAMVLSEYWKRLENFFQNDTIFTISSKKYHFKKIFLLAFFHYSDRTVASTETNDISAESSWSQLFGAKRKRMWHYQEGATPTCCKRTLKKKQI